MSTPIPVPSPPLNEKPQYSRPTSAGSFRSELPCSRPSSACTRPSFTVRPGSAQSQHPPIRRPGSAGTAGRRSPSPLSMDGQYDTSRRALEEELTEPILAPVPTGIATPLERQLAKAIGLTGPSVPRLPRDVVSCDKGARCCWRWLARAAIDDVSGKRTIHLTIGEAVSSLKAELRTLRSNFTSAEVQRQRAELAEEEAERLRESNIKAMHEVKEFRQLERETGRVQSECVELKLSIGRLEAQIQSQIAEIAKLKSERELVISAATADLETRLEETQRELMKAHAKEDDLVKRLDYEISLRKKNAEAARPKAKAKALSREVLRKQREARRAELQKKARQKASRRKKRPKKK